MEKLSDFKPLERVELPNLGELDCSGLILLVGPNSSGKTQLLHDLYQRIKGEPRKLVVAREIKLRKPEFEPFLSSLVRDGYLTEFDDGSGTKLRPTTTYVGSGQAAQPITANQAQQWHQGYQEDTPGASPRRSEFLLYFGGFVV